MSGGDTQDDEFAEVFAGPLAGCAGKLTWQSAPDARTAADLADRATFDSLIGRFQATHSCTDRHAAISFWSQIYFSSLTIPAAILTLWRGKALPLGFDATRVSFCLETGVPLVFRMTPPPDHASTGPDLRPLVEEHLAPLIAILKKHSGLSAKLFWENAGWYLVWILSEMGRRHPAHSTAIRDILADPSWPTGRTNPLERMKQAALQDLPVDRRVCCLRYRIRGFGRCERICPLAPADSSPH